MDSKAKYRIENIFEPRSMAIGTAIRLTGELYTFLPLFMNRESEFTLGPRLGLCLELPDTKPCFFTNIYSTVILAF